MGPTFRHHLVPRGYESDGSTFVSLANLLFLSEEARVTWSFTPEGAPLGRSEHQLARVQRLVVHTPIATHAELAIEVRIARVGRTSYEALHRFLAPEDDRLLATVACTLVCTDGRGAKAEVPRALAAMAFPTPTEGLPDPGVDAPADAFRLAFPVLPSDENRGGHLSHARVAEHLDDVRRLAGLRGALGPDTALGSAPAQAITIVYEREARFGDELEALAFPLDHGLAEARLRVAGTHELVARARIASRSA